MTRQEENWEFVTWLQFKWQECDEISAEDREFLLKKVEEVKEQSKQYYEEQQKAYDEQLAQQQAALEAAQNQPVAAPGVRQDHMAQPQQPGHPGHGQRQAVQPWG